MNNENERFQFGIIYKVTNLINGKFYIGQTCRTLHKRKLQHIRDAKNCKHKNNFCRSLINYKTEEWKWEIVYILNESDNIDELEIKYIRENDSYFDGYNSTLGGNPFRMSYRSDEEKKHIQYKLDRVNLKYYYKIFKDGKLIYHNETLKYFCQQNNINYESFRVQVGRSGYQGDYIIERIPLSVWNKINQEEYINYIPDSVINKINEIKPNHDKYEYKIFKNGILVDVNTNLKNFCKHQKINYRLFDNHIRRKGKYKGYTLERIILTEV